MKTLLIFPPVMWNFGPYLSLPSLTAFLRKEGFEVDQRDVNAQLHDIIFTREGLNGVYTNACERFSELNGKKQLSVIEQEEYLDLINGPVGCLPPYLNSVEENKEAFKNIENYKLGRGEIRPMLEPYWRDYTRIKQMTIPDENFLYDLPSYSLHNLHDLVEGRHKLPYQDLLVQLISKIIDESRPNVVGISFPVASQLLPGLLIAHLIKQQIQAHVTVGGPYWTAMRQSAHGLLKQIPFIDSVALYEGEQTLVELIRALQNEKSLSAVPNLITRESIRGLKENTHVINDINILPCPDYMGLDLGLYFAPRPVLTYASARGCYHNKCAFCNFQSPNARFRTRNIDLVIKDLKKLSKDISTLFYFSQECETPLRFDEMAEAMITNELHLHYQVFARLDPRFNKRILGKMKTSGCQYIFFGLEAGSQRVNDLIKKGVDLNEARRIIDDCHTVGQNVVVSSIKGFPTESDSEFGATQGFYHDIRKAYSKRIRIAGSSHFFRLVRGSLVDRKPEMFNVKSVYRDAAGDLALTYPGFTMSDSQHVAPLSERLERYLQELPDDILFNEYLVLIMSSLAPDNIVSLSTIIDKKGKENEKQNGDKNDISHSTLTLNRAATLITCRFNLSEIQRRSRERRKSAWKQFLDEGIPIMQILESFRQTEEPLGPKPCVQVANGEKGNFLLLSPRMASLVEKCREGSQFTSLRKELTSLDLPDRPEDLKRLLSKLVENNILLQHEYDPA